MFQIKGFHSTVLALFLRGSNGNRKCCNEQRKNHSRPSERGISMNRKTTLAHFFNLKSHFQSTLKHPILKMLSVIIIS